MITIDESRCTLCGLCLPVCVRRILQEGKKSVEVTDPELCMLCGHCQAVCPTDAWQFTAGNEEFIPAPHREEIPEPNTFLRFLRRRRSLRVYQNKLVEKEKLKKIIEAGRYAPTGSNRQACAYEVFGGREILDPICALAIQTLEKQGREMEEILDRLRRKKEPIPEELLPRQYLSPVWARIARKWAAGEDQLLHQAPALVVIHMKKNLATTPEFDAGIASAQMILMAETLGLGTCYIGFLIMAIENSPELKEMMRIPADHRALLAFTVGYANVEFLKLVARKPAQVEWIGDFA